MVKVKILRSILIGILMFAIQFTSSADTFQERLQQLDGVVSVEKIDHSDFFQSKYVCFVEQFIDHNDPEKGTFNQRVIVSHYGDKNPVVLITEGYSGAYGLRKSNVNELCPIVEGNQILVEHRFFSESVPETPDWDDLTVENAAADYAAIVDLFDDIYTGKWISTGISKGGQTTLLFHAYYPKCVDIWVPYVAPLNFELEEQRHPQFIQNVVPQDCAQNIENFQHLVLNNRSEIEPLLSEYIKQKNYHFRISTPEVLDYMVLEFSFAFWQWGGDCNFPDESASADSLFNTLNSISNCNYFALEGIKKYQPFFIQAYRQMGYYAYDTTPFEGELVIENANGYVKNLFIPEGVTYRYDKGPSKKVRRSVNRNGDHIMCIYGEFDPWTASAVELRKRSKAIKYVDPNGSHLARISTLPDEMKNEAIETLKKWLAE